MKDNYDHERLNSIITVANTNLAYHPHESSTFGGLPDYFRKMMQDVSEESIVTLQKNLKKNALDCDLYTWNFETWGYNYKVRQTPRNLRLNLRHRVHLDPKNMVKQIVDDLECERGYSWEEIKNSQNYSQFKSFLIVRWVKLLAAVILTFAIVYTLVYLFNIQEVKDGQTQVKADIWFKLGLYACFIPVLIYAYSLFANTEDSFMKIFKPLLVARKKSLGQVLNKYNREKLSKFGLIIFFDEPGFNFVIGKKETVSGYGEIYPTLDNEEMSLLTGDDNHTYFDIEEVGVYNRNNKL